MTRRESTNQSCRDQLFLVHFVKGSTTIGALKEIQDMFQVIITWERYRPQHRDVTQCLNCLCARSGGHLTGSCGQADDIDLKCANCGENHRATTRTCSKRAEFIDIRHKSTIGNQPGRQRSARLPPANTESHYPALQPRRVVPNLEPLPLNNHQASAQISSNKQAVNPGHSAQIRLSIAATQPNQGSARVPGLSYAGAAASALNDDSPFTAEELVEIMSEVMTIMRTCRTRTQQLQAVTSFINKYGP
ncbi:uncharacterized protein LOC129761334 [Toxorhynchites rutilus septentrionalis]|uniref:uncharacterized protein LOC129761334 n=1 Tax=Toxorhynchites rutilus septentrionalis TaxID=329112 RepID=UPI002478968C|nr:uncharacterized protein LOC129761334 [Toxorhynchites rutilus septentrionalis]